MEHSESKAEPNMHLLCNRLTEKATELSMMRFGVEGLCVAIKSIDSRGQVDALDTKKNHVISEISRAFQDALNQAQTVVARLCDVVTRSHCQVTILRDGLHNVKKYQRSKLWLKCFRICSAKKALREIRKIDLSVLRMDECTELIPAIVDATVAFQKVERLCKSRSRRLSRMASACQISAALLDFVRELISVVGPVAAAIISVKGQMWGLVLSILTSGADIALKQLIDKLRSKLRIYKNRLADIKKIELQRATEAGSGMSKICEMVGDLQENLGVTASIVRSALQSCRAVHALVEDEVMKEISDQAARLNQLKESCSVLGDNLVNALEQLQPAAG